jgi:hypothetical protein
MLGNMVSSRNVLKWFYIQLPLWFKWLGMKKAIPRGMDKVVDGAQWLSVLQAVREPSTWLSFMQTRPSTRFVCDVMYDDVSISDYISSVIGG